MTEREQAVRGAVTEETRRYIAETAWAVSQRIERDRGWEEGLSLDKLAQDVAWIARQLVKLAQ